MRSSDRPTVIDILRLSTGYLEEKGIESPRLTAEIFLADILGCQRIDLYLWFDRPMEEPELYTMRRFLRLRAGGMPVEYITKKSGFYGLQLSVDPRVMIPRPETEVLVEKVLELIEGPSVDRGERGEFLFLDLGTGSGAIGLAILDQLPGSVVVATDVSPDALRVAWENACNLDLSHRFIPLLGDLYRPIKRRDCFDLVISNPPYIPDRDRENLPREVRDYEPPVALYTGEDGLRYVEGIVTGAVDVLKAGGILAVEVGDGQGAETEKRVASVEGLSMLSLERDLCGVERIVLAKKEVA